MPATVVVAHVIKVPFRLGDIKNESVEVLHGRLGPVTAFTAVKGGHGRIDDEGWPLQTATPDWSKSRVQLGDDVIHLVVPISPVLLGMLQVNCTAVFGHSWSEQGWPFDAQGSDCPDDSVNIKCIHVFDHKNIRTSLMLQIYLQQSTDRRGTSDTRLVWERMEERKHSLLLSKLWDPMGYYKIQHLSHAPEVVVITL